MPTDDKSEPDSKFRVTLAKPAVRHVWQNPRDRYSRYR